MPPESSPDFSNVGMGAEGNVHVNHDASQHVTSHHTTTTHTTHHHTDTSRTENVHHDNSDRRIDQSTTHVHSGLSGRVALALAGVIVLGFAVTAYLLRPQPPAPAPLVVLPAPSPVVVAPPSRTLPKDEPAPRMEAAATTPVVVKPVAAPEGRALEISLNRSSYRVGDLMEITVTTRQAGHLHVLAVWADGRVDTLFPNTLRPDARVSAGTTLRLPNDLPATADGQVLRYPMALPDLPGNPDHAVESIIAVLSPTPLSLPAPVDLASAPGFAAVGMIADADFRTRGPQPQFIRLKQAPTLDFGGLPQAAVHYEIRR